MKCNYSYRDSHKMDGKGLSYDCHYSEDLWSKFLWSREQIILSDIINIYFNKRDIHLLDFACGTGRISNYLEHRTKTSVGIDVSSSMLEIAKGKLKRTALIQSDLTSKNVLQGRKFNLITAFRFFLNAEPDLRNAVMKVLVTLMSEDGYLVFNNHHNLTAPIMLWSYFRNRINSKGVNNFMSIREIKNLVKDYNLEIVRFYPVGFFRIPKVNLPVSWKHKMEDFSMKFKWLYPLSESPIVVCKHQM